MSYCKTSSTEIGSLIFYQDKDIRQIVTVLHYHHYLYEGYTKCGNSLRYFLS